MDRTLALGMLLSGACIAMVAQPCRAQDGARVNRADTGVTREYYTQLHASIDMQALPQTGAAARNAFRSLLGALGGRNEARSIVVSVKVAIGDLELPEYSLASYDYDSKSRRLSIFSNSGHDFPRKRLDPDEKIAVDVTFRDSDQGQYQLNAVTQSLVGMVPGSSLVSLASRPFVQGMGKLGNEVITAMGNAETSRKVHYEFSPFEGGIKQVSLPLAGADGKPFATVQLDLRASPTLLRVGRDVFQAGAQDLVLRADEDPSNLELEIGGVHRSYLDELKGIASYGELAHAPSPASVRAFCGAARTFLGTQHGLAMMDRTELTLRALEDAGYQDHVHDTAWFHACFLPSEEAALAVANHLTVPPPTAAEPDPIDNATLWALGCWMITDTGPQCARKAPQPQATLDASLADALHYGIDSSFVGTLDWPDREVVQRPRLLEAIKGVATGFSCFNHGMLVTTATGVFRLEGEVSQGRMERIVIRPVPQDALGCTM